MAQPHVVLAECLDIWLQGGDPTPLLERHPDVATETLALLETAERVRKSAPAPEVEIDVERIRRRERFIAARGREMLLTPLRRMLTMMLTSR